MLPSEGFSGVAVDGDHLYVARDQAEMAVTPNRVFLSQLNAGDEVVQLDKATLAARQVYGAVFEPNVTVAFDPESGQRLGAISNLADIFGRPVTPRLYADDQIVSLTGGSGCCGSNVGLFDPGTLAPLQTIDTLWPNAVRLKQQLLVVGDEAGTVKVFDTSQRPAALVAQADLRNLTGHTGSEDIEIRALWVDAHDNLVFAASSWANDSSRGPTLPSLFVLELTAAGVPASVTPPVLPTGAVVGTTLYAGRGGWTNSPTDYGYEFQSCDAAGNNCIPIAGLTPSASWYTPRTTDIGRTLRVKVTASNGAGAGAPATSNQTAAVTADGIPASVTPPVLPTGAVVGTTLYAGRGGWTNSPTDYRYEFQSCDAAGNDCVRWPGPTPSACVVHAAHYGHRPHAARQGHGEQRRRRRRTRHLQPHDGRRHRRRRPRFGHAAGAPDRRGRRHDSLRRPRRLDEQPHRLRLIEFQSCDAAGNNCIPIAGLTPSASWYTPRTTDIGHTLRVKVTASNGAGAGAPATSNRQPPSPERSRSDRTHTGRAARDPGRDHGRGARPPRASSQREPVPHGSGGRCGSSRPAPSCRSSCRLSASTSGCSSRRGRCSAPCSASRRPANGGRTSRWGAARPGHPRGQRRPSASPPTTDRTTTSSRLSSTR